MDVVFPRCAGLHVHKKSITACRMVPDPIGQEGEGITELKTFGTMTRDLLALADWLTAAESIKKLGVTCLSGVKCASLSVHSRWEDTP